MKNNFGLAVIIFLLGICGVVLAYPINDGLPGDLGDMRFNLYVLEHFYLALTGRVDSFVSANFYYPLTQTILFADRHHLIGLIYSYFRVFGLSPTYSFFFWFFCGFILNYWLSFYVLRKFELSQLAAAIGAFLFTFGLPVIAQDGHAQLIYRPFVPLAFLTFFYYTKSKNFYHLSLTGLFLSLQLLISVYNGIFLFYLLFIWAVVEIALTPKDKIKNFLPHEFCLKKSLPILASAIVVFLFFAIPYLEVKNLYNLSRSVWEVSETLPRIQSYFLADNSNLWVKDLKIFSAISGRWEHQMFIGIGPLLALLFLYFRKNLIEKGSLAHKFSLNILALIVATIYLGGVSLYYSIGIFPGISSLRVISREILVMLFLIAYLVGFSLDKIRATNFATLSSSAVIGLICFLTIIDPILADKSIVSTKDVQDRLEILSSKITQPLDKESIIVTQANEVKDEIDAMLLSQKLGIKTINGYSGIFPSPGWYLIDTCDKAKARLRDIEAIMHNTKQSYQLDRRKIIAIGFDEKCDFTKEISK